MEDKHQVAFVPENRSLSDSDILSFSRANWPPKSLENNPSGRTVPLKSHFLQLKGELSLTHHITIKFRAKLVQISLELEEHKFSLH